MGRAVVNMNSLFPFQKLSLILVSKKIGPCPGRTGKEFSMNLGHRPRSSDSMDPVALNMGVRLVMVVYW